MSGRWDVSSTGAQVTIDGRSRLHGDDRHLATSAAARSCSAGHVRPRWANGPAHGHGRPSSRARAVSVVLDGVDVHRGAVVDRCGGDTLESIAERLQAKIDSDPNFEAQTTGDRRVSRCAASRTRARSSPPSRRPRHPDCPSGVTDCFSTHALGARQSSSIVDIERRRGHPAGRAVADHPQRGPADADRALLRRRPPRRVARARPARRPRRRRRRDRRARHRAGRRDERHRADDA